MSQPCKLAVVGAGCCCRNYTNDTNIRTYKQSQFWTWHVYWFWMQWLIDIHTKNNACGCDIVSLILFLLLLKTKTNKNICFIYGIFVDQYFGLYITRIYNIMYNTLKSALSSRWWNPAPFFIMDASILTHWASSHHYDGDHWHIISPKRPPRIIFDSSKWHS